MAEFEITLTGSTELTNNFMPYVVIFDLNTLSGTQIVTTCQPLEKVCSVEASNLAVTNFLATLNGAPLFSLPSATGHFIGTDSVPNTDPGQFFEPLLSVNNAFSWDFLSPTAISLGKTSDPVEALILGHEGPGIGGSLGNNIISFQTLSIVDITPSPTSVPEPETLPLLAVALAALLACRFGYPYLRRRWRLIAEPALGRLAPSVPQMTDPRGFHVLGLSWCDLSSRRSLRLHATSNSSTPTMVDRPGKSTGSRMTP